MATTPKISVITCSVRPEGLKLVEKALKRQTFKDFEWIIQGRDGEIPKGCVWTLNRDYNMAIAKAKGELIVSWQDYTYASPQALEKFFYYFKTEPKTLVTGVGNKYTDDSFTTQTWRDPRDRSDQGSFYPCFFCDIEWNFCSVPKAALYAVGGFDEWLDYYYGMDGYSVLDRLNLLSGWDFKIDQTNRSYSLEHSRPEDWEEKNALHGPYNERRKQYMANPVLDYLK